MIDQAWQPRLPEGMVRAYLVEDRVAGFGHQAVNALHPDRAHAGAAPVPRPELPGFQDAEAATGVGWISCCASGSAWRANGCRCCGTATFMLGDRGLTAPQRFVLCEINVSSVSPFPPSSIAPLVEAVKAKLAAAPA
jgi:hypothetical protein